jgi:hypothetical protein
MFGIYDGTKVIARFTTPMSVVSNVPVFASDTMSLKHSVGKRAAQRWEITTNLEPLVNDANTLFAMMVTNGTFQPFSVVVPQNYGALKLRVVSGSIPVMSGSADSTVISVGGNTGNYIPVGTMVRFGSAHTKVYMTTSALNGNGTVSIFPKLRVGLTNATLYWKNDVIAPFYFDPSTLIGMSYTDGIVMDNGEIKLLEDV